MAHGGGPLLGPGVGVDGRVRQLVHELFALFAQQPVALGQLLAQHADGGAELVLPEFGVLFQLFNGPAHFFRITAGQLHFLFGGGAAQPVQRGVQFCRFGVGGLKLGLPLGQRLVDAGFLNFQRFYAIPVAGLKFFLKLGSAALVFCPYDSGVLAYPGFKTRGEDLPLLGGGAAQAVQRGVKFRGPGIGNFKLRFPFGQRLVDTGFLYLQRLYPVAVAALEFLFELGLAALVFRADGRGALLG